MLQRKQTLFLLLSIIAMVVCMVIPVMEMMPMAMGTNDIVYNLWTLNADRTYSFDTWPLAVCLLLTVILCTVTIFKYTNRKLQMSLCRLSMAITVLWYVLYAVYGLMILPDNSEMRISFGACLPLVALILEYLALQGIRHDEKLVRAADRIR